MKLVIESISVFGLSSQAMKLWAEKKGIELYPYSYDLSDYTKQRRVNWGDEDIESYCSTKRWNDQNEIVDWTIDRGCPHLIEVVSELGGDVASQFGYLKIIEIPDNVEYVIVENGMGGESVHEKHRIWN
jgi:hypothetical protein